MEESVKLEKIKRSCTVGEKVSTVFCILSIVGCVLAIVAGIAVVNMGRKFDDKVLELSESGVVNIGNKIGSCQVMGISLGDPSNIESDVPAIREALKDHPYSIEVGMYCLLIALSTAVVAVMMKLTGSVFALIRQEDSPFTDKVIKRVAIVMIVLSAFVFLTSGVGMGVLCGILTWVVYTVLDYGRTLQIQADETL